jgi:hypothetical protein
MKLLRIRTLVTFGIGFLAGSAAGPGPWQKAQAGLGELKGKVAGGNGEGRYGSTSSNGIEGQRGGQGKPAMTEM